MTVVIGVLCSDGVILASDSQATEMTGGVRFSGDKVFPLTDRALWGASGSVQVIDDIGQAFDQARPILNAGVPEIGNALANLVRPQLIKHYGLYVQIPGYGANPPITLVLACGYSPQTGGWIVEVDANCAYSHYGQRGFHAIGSGAGFAQLANASLAHFQVKDKPLSHGKLVAYRAVDTVIRTSAAGVGPPIQMSAVDANGVHKLSDEEIHALGDSVGLWMALESETLDSYLNLPPAQPETPMPSAMEAAEPAAATPEPAQFPQANEQESEAGAGPG